MNKVRDIVEEGFVKEAKIVFKAADLYKVKYSPCCVSESEVIDKVEDAFAIVVLAVEEDDIISDLDKRKEALAEFKNGLYTSAGITYVEMFGTPLTFAFLLTYISEESPLWSSYSFVAISEYLHTIKCRCKKAKVIDIINTATGERITDGFEVRSKRDPMFMYEIGGIVRPYNIYDNVYDNDPLTICGPGIHYFNHLWEAFAYGLSDRWSMSGLNGKNFAITPKKDGVSFKVTEPFWSIQADEDLIQFERVKAYVKREIMGDGDNARVEFRGDIVHDNGESGED